MELIDQLIKVSNAVQAIQLLEQEKDKITWKLTNHDEYTTTSVYNAQLLSTMATNFKNLIWKPWMPRKCKTFA